jgi:hypothetical protein
MRSKSSGGGASVAKIFSEDMAIDPYQSAAKIWWSVNGTGKSIRYSPRGLLPSFRNPDEIGASEISSGFLN